MAQIFLSYRRSDSEYATGRIADRLVEALGRGAVFRDVDSIGYGDDFEVHVRNILENCAVMLVIIGDEWISVTDKDGKRRLDDPGDLVRREVVSAMNNGTTRVIPVLIGDAVMPTEDQLPDDLKALAKRNAATVRADADFNHQMKDLVKVILESAPELSPMRRYGKLLGMAAAGVLLVVLAYVAYQTFSPPTDLTRITWNAENFSVRTLEFGQTRYQAVYLRTGGEQSAALPRDMSRKYELDIVVVDENGGSADGLLTVTPVEYDQLPADHQKENAVFLMMEAGNRQGEAQVTVQYQNPGNGQLIVSNPKVRKVSVLATRELEREAREAIAELRDMIDEAGVSDARIRRIANNRLQDLDGSTLKNIFDAAQTAELEELRTKAQTAADQYARANGMAAGAVSLDMRDEAWKTYLASAGDLGRSGTHQISEAQKQLDAIGEFRNTSMESVEYEACSSVSDRNCRGGKSCFAPGEKITSWAKMKVNPATARITHELVQVNDESRTDDDAVVDKDDTTVQASAGYRTWKALASRQTGKHQIRIRHGNVIVVSKDVTVGNCR